MATGAGRVVQHRGPGPPGDLDGRPPLGKDIQLYMGDSRARWEGNTLVINTSNFNNKSWFDIVGGFHSDAMRVEERFTVVSADNIDYRVTITDPRVYTRPWTIAVSMRPIKDEGYEIIEEACHEGERSAGDIYEAGTIKTVSSLQSAVYGAVAALQPPGPPYHTLDNASVAKIP